MIKFVRAVIVGLAATALLVTGTVSAQAAAPKPTSQSAPQTSQPTQWQTRTEPSATVRDFLKRSANTVLGNHGWKRLDYRVAVKKFGSHYRWRRRFAAGWMGYYAVIHISKAERKKVVALAKKYHTARHTGSTGVTPMNGCTGRSGVTKSQMKGGGWEVYTYWNSCQTNDYIDSRTQQETIMCGLIGAISGALLASALTPVGGTIAGATIGALCEETMLSSLKKFKTAQWSSSKNAIEIITQHPGTWGKKYLIGPQ